MKSAQIRKRPNLKNRGLVRVASRFAGEIRKSCFPRTRTGIHCSAQDTQVRAMPPRSVQNPSKPVTDPTHKTPGQGTPGLAMHRPDTAVESDRLSGQARRGLDRALAVGGGLGGGGMHRVGACRGGGGGGPGVARVVSMTKTTEGRSGGGGVGARRSPAGRRGRLAQSVRVAGAACMHYTPPIP